MGLGRQDYDVILALIDKFSGRSLFAACGIEFEVMREDVRFMLPKAIRQAMSAAEA